MAATPADTPPIDRLIEIRQIWKDNHWLYGLVGFLLGALAFPLFNRLIGDALTLLGNLVPEAVGIVFTVLIIDRLYQRREEARKIEELKARLLREARSPVHALAVQAINEIREHGWLTGEDGLLKGINLRGANLVGADLTAANLQHTNLMDARLQGASLESAQLQNASLVNANLQGASLRFAKLQNADLDAADLQGASLVSANLQSADLWSANLQNALLGLANLQSTDLRAANLEGANLWKSNLENANIIDAEFDASTTLPVQRKWSPDMIEKVLTQQFGCVFISYIENQNAYEKWQSKRLKQDIKE